MPDKVQDKVQDKVSDKVSDKTGDIGKIDFRPGLGMAGKGIKNVK